MSRGRPPLEDIRKHFEKVTEVEEQILQINFLLWLAGSFQFQLLQPLLNGFRFIHSKLRACLNNDRVKKLVALYQNLRIRKEISEDIWFEDDEN